MRELRVVISPSATSTRVIATAHTESGSETLLKARLSAEPSHPRALSWLLESIALWQGQSVRAVLAVDGSRTSSGTRLYADWFADFGGALYTLEVVDLREQRERRVHRDRIEAMGSYADLRQLVLFRGGARR